MNILFLTIGRVQNINDRGIYTDLLRYFRDQGHSIYVVSSLERRSKKNTKLTNDDEVLILQVKIGNITKTNIIEKGISTLMIEHQYIRAIKKKMNNISIDLIIYSTPPVTFYNVVKYLKIKNNAKTYLLLKDIFPQNAVDLGLLKKRSLIYKYFKWKEEKFYNISDFIGCMSEANVDYIKSNNKLDNKIVEVCPNSIDNRFKVKRDMKEAVRIKYGLPLESTIFVYGGNLGKPQGIDFLLKCLMELSLEKGIFILIIGSGTEFNRINEYVETNKPSNVRLQTSLTVDQFDEVVSSCDVGMVFLDNRFTIPNFPSRILSYMKLSKPIIAAIDKSTDLGKIMEDNNFGLFSESGDVFGFINNTKKLNNESIRLKMGLNGYNYLINNYDVKNSYDIIMSHFNI